MAKRILSAYRKDDYADPDGFVASIGMIFERYPDEIIKAVSDPVTGIQSKSDYPPSLAKVSDACKEEYRRQIQLRKWRNMKREPRQIAGPLSIANLYVPKGNSQYDGMVERSRSADKSEFRFDDGGIWVAETWVRAGGYVGVR